MTSEADAQQMHLASPIEVTTIAKLVTRQTVGLKAYCAQTGQASYSCNAENLPDSTGIA